MGVHPFERPFHRLRQPRRGLAILAHPVGIRIEDRRRIRARVERRFHAFRVPEIREDASTGRTPLDDGECGIRHHRRIDGPVLHRRNRRGDGADAGHAHRIDGDAVPTKQKRQQHVRRRAWRRHAGDPTFQVFDRLRRTSRRSHEHEARKSEHRHERDQCASLGRHLDRVVVEPADDVSAAAHERLQRLCAAGMILQLHVEAGVTIEAELAREGGGKVRQLVLAANRQAHAMGTGCRWTRTRHRHE